MFPARPHEFDWYNDAHRWSVDEELSRLKPGTLVCLIKDISSGSSSFFYEMNVYSSGEGRPLFCEPATLITNIPTRSLIDSVMLVIKPETTQRAKGIDVKVLLPAQWSRPVWITSNYLRTL